jgi:hypothetical protein
MGNNTQVRFQFQIQAPYSENSVSFYIRDDFTGWKDINVIINRGNKMGTPDFTNIMKIQLVILEPNVIGEWKIGELYLQKLERETR